MPLTAPSLLFDVTDDFLVFDNRETILYLSRQPGEVFIDPDVTCLTRHGAVNEPEQSGAEQQAFHVRPKDLTYPPKPRDNVLRSDGSVWVVNAVNLETFGSRYRLDCTKARASTLDSDLLTNDDGEPLVGDSGNILFGA